MIKLKLELGNSLQIIDTSFSHSSSIVNGTDPLYFNWTRKLNSLDHIFLTNEEIFSVEYYRRQGFKIIIGLFYESPAILSKEFKKFFKRNINLDLLLTSNSKMLSLNNTKWIPGGGIWNFEELDSFNHKFSIKSKNISLVCSGKNVSRLHRLRRNAFDSFMFNSNVDTYGPPLNNNLGVDTYLDPYRFSIIYENFKDDVYFTEKILNCFASAVIPIYNGAMNIGDFFDSSGILTFSSNNDLYNIVRNLSERDYLSRFDAIKNNFSIARRDYRCVEDFIINKKIILIS